MQNKNQYNQVILKLITELFANPVIQFFLDPMIPKLITFYLQRYLNNWQKKGLIKKYHVEVQRLGKLYYKIGLHALAAEKETNISVLNYISSRVENILNQTIK